MANHLQKIVARANQIHKAQPRKKWIECIKAAAKELKAGKKIGSTPPLSRLHVKKSRPKAGPTKKTRTVVVKKVQQLAGLAGVSGNALQKISNYNAMIAKLESDLKANKSHWRISEKNRARRAISTYKLIIRNLKKLV